MTLFSWIGELFSSDARHNAKLYRSGGANKNEVRLTTVGWRPDPINKQDGFTKSDGLKGGPSGNENGEYYQVVRKSKKGK